MKSVLAFLPVAFAAISSTQMQTFDAEHMKETFKAIAAQSGEIDAPTRTNIQKILDLIQGNLTAALKEDYDIVITAYRNQESELKACNTELGNCSTKDVDPALGDYQESVQKHVNCRNFQHQVCSEMIGNCSIADNRVKKYEPPRWPGVSCDDECDGDEDGPVFSFMKSALNFVCAEGQGCAEDQTWEECFDTVPQQTGSLPQKGCNQAEREAHCTNGANGTYCPGCDYASCRANCGIVAELFTSQLGQCDNLQGETETDHCNFLEAGCHCCDNFFKCWTSKSNELDDERNRVSQVINLIHTQQEALECLLCYGAQILQAGVTDFETCERQGCVGCGSMSIPGSNVSPDYSTSNDCREAKHGDYDTVDLQYEPVPHLNSNCATSTGALQTCILCAQPAKEASAYVAAEEKYNATEYEWTAEPVSEPNFPVLAPAPAPEPAPEVEPEPASDVEPEPAIGK